MPAVKKKHMFMKNCNSRERKSNHHNLKEKHIHIASSECKSDNHCQRNVLWHMTKAAENKNIHKHLTFFFYHGKKI